MKMNQHAFYNYQLHEKEKLKAISQRNEMLIWMSGIISVAAVLAFVLLWINFMRRKQRLMLYEALGEVLMSALKMVRKPHLFHLSPNSRHTQKVNISSLMTMAIVMETEALPIRSMVIPSHSTVLSRATGLSWNGQKTRSNCGHFFHQSM